MNPGRSIRACSLCRRRRVKCDKTLPTCVRCAKFGQICPGYPLFKTFIDQRNKARQRVSEHAAQTSTFQDTISHIETPLTNVNENSLIIPSPDLTTTSNGADDAVQNVDWEIGAHMDGDFQYFDLDIESYYADGNNACGFFADLADIEAQNIHVDQLDTATTSSETRVNQNATSGPNDPAVEESRSFEAIEYDSETSLLMRLYVEMLAPWMDLFDTGAYFTRIVPCNSALDTLLMLALTAVAAKQTARYLVSRHPSRYSKLFDLVLAEHSNDNPDQWFYRAASYYDRGISHLRTRLQELNEKYGSFESRNVVSNMFNPSSQLTPSVMSLNRQLVSQKATSYEQNVLSAVSMFSFYETLDECIGNPSQHLTGFLALAEILNTRTPLQAEAQLLFASMSAGRAAFWYFVRKDMLTSYSCGSKPAFDTECHQLWIAAGLPSEVVSIQRDGHPPIEPQNSLGLDVSEDLQTMTYVIIWLSLRVVSMTWHYGRSPSLSAESYTSPASSATVPQIRLEEVDNLRAHEWTTVREYLNWWFKFRPQIFHAYASQTKNTTIDDGGKINKTTFFACSTGAAVMQLYHFIQIILLLNQPTTLSSESNQTSKLRALKKTNREIESHSLKICEIALEVPAFAVQRQMSQPLQLAGVYLDSSQDKAVIMSTLAKVSKETCSPTENVV